MINIDLDITLVEYIKEKCNKAIDKDIEEMVKVALKEKKLENNVNISISVASVSEIHELNKKYREVDKPTDVLSFPIFSREEIESDSIVELQEIDLGDIIICIDVVEEHAKEYETGILRETMYMITHGICHLIGYDHENEVDKKEMRALEEKILSKIGVNIVNE